MNNKRTLDRYDTRYVWGDTGSILTGSAELPPNVSIEAREPIPPLTKAALMRVDYVSVVGLDKSNIHISWNVAGSAVRLMTWCLADDPRLKEQYRLAPDFAQKVVDMLVQCKKTGKTASAQINTSSELTAGEIPECLKPYVEQAKLWHVFLKKYSHGLYTCQAAVSSEGFLLLLIRGRSLRLTDNTRNYADEDCSVALEQYFYFDPEKHKPIVTADLAYWELPEEKVLVILDHAFADERIANRFGYTDAFAKYHAGKKEFRRRFEDVGEKRRADDAAKLEAARTEVLKKLLSS